MNDTAKTHDYIINNRLFDSYLERMNFLNEVSIDYPEAISFGSGRPDKRFFSVKNIIDGFHTFAESGDGGTGDAGDFFDDIGQYNKTKGIICDAIQKLIANDEAIEVHADDIMVTDGAQEGMAIVINSLIESPDDVILVSDPSYIGFVGYAKIYGAPVVPIKRDENSIDLAHLEATVKELKKEGKNPKVLYEVPDFHNPTGTYMPLEKREKLIQAAEDHNFLIVEDNPYGYFRYGVEKIPTLKALDKYKRVIHLGSFAKTLFPALRLGYLVVDQEIQANGRRFKLVEEFKKTKSFTTVNTSPLLQAMTGSFLREHDYSLQESCKRKVEVCREKRDVMINALEENFPASESWTEGISWGKPDGGFFLAVNIPFAMTDELLKECVEKYGVIFCPMSFFCLDEEAGAHQIRLAFSNLFPEKIREGIGKLAAFIKSKIV